MQYIRKALLLCILFCVLGFSQLSSTKAATPISVSVNGQSEITGASLDAVLKQYPYHEVTSLSITGGTLTQQDMDLLKSTAAEGEEPQFLLRNLRRFVVDASVTFAAPIPTKFMFMHPSLESVSLDCANSLTIGAFAFAECEALTSAVLPSATALEASVFRTCGKLKTVEIPRAMSLGAYVFNGCGSLEAVTFGVIAPPDISNDCFPPHVFTLRVPKGLTGTYQMRCAAFPQLLYQEYGNSSEPPVDGGSLELSGTAEAAYTVSVTPTVAFGYMKKDNAVLTKEFEISADNLFLEENQQLKAIISGEADGFYMKTRLNSKVPLQVMDSNGTEVEPNGLFATFHSDGQTQKGNLVLNQLDLPYAGDYSGVLTFEFRVEDKN